MLKILQARLKQYMNQELTDVKSGFRKGRGIRDRIANIHWIIKRAREFQENVCFIDYAKAFDCVDQNKLWRILKEMGDRCILILSCGFSLNPSVVYWSKLRKLIGSGISIHQNSCRHCRGHGVDRSHREASAFSPKHSNYEPDG